MPLAESEAVILRSSNFGEADKLVSFFSRTLGRLRGVAPNARRSRRRFGASLEPLSHVRLWFFERERDDLVRLSESELIEPYYDARGDYERSVALNQVAELSDLLLPEREPAERSFRLLLAVLRGFQQAESVWLPLTYFQLWMARLAGWLPSLDTCSQCQQALDGEQAYGNPTTGKIYCVRCRVPRVPAGGFAEYQQLTEASGNLIGICPCCNCRRTGRDRRCRAIVGRGSS